MSKCIRYGLVRQPDSSHIYYENNDALYKEIQATYFGRMDRRTRKVVPNFIMNANNDPFFQKFIANRSSAKNIDDAIGKQSIKLTNRLLLQAYKFLRESLEDVTYQGGEEFNPESLITIEDFISKRLSVILILVSDEADAYTLFETLNERGLELSVLDLLKNHIFKKADNQIETVKSRWIEMFANLDDKIGVRFLRHYWVSRHGRVQAGQLFRDIREKTGTQSQALNLSEDLLECSYVYNALSISDHPLWDDFRKRVRSDIYSLNVLNAVQCYPVLLGAYEKLDSDNFERVVRQMVVIAVRYSLICGLRTGALEIRYADVALQISTGKIRSAGGVYQAIKDLYPDDDAFRASFQTKEVRIAKQARYLLRQLEMEASGPDLEPTLDTGKLNLEHIAPRIMSENWRDIGDLQGKDYDDWVYRIGNQVLLEGRVNRELSRKPYNEKKTFLKEARLALTKSAAQYERWTTEAIAKRQAELSELAVSCWRYDL